MGDGTKESPFTREDVLRLIKENGGTAEGLDLSEKWFEKGIDLTELDLKGIILINAHLEGANLGEAHLEGAYLGEAHLEGTYLLGAHLEGANLSYAHLEGADLWVAHLEGATLWGARFSSDTKLEDADWGNYILSEEKNGLFDWAVATYRQLKVWYANAGIHDIAAKFYYREKEAGRKALRWRSKLWYHRLALEASRWLFGYGEQWWRIIIWMALFIFGPTAAYYLSGELDLLYSLYFSVVSFTALGYGKWVNFNPQGWIQALGAIQSVAGIFLMTLFLVTFIRKMTR